MDLASTANRVHILGGAGSGKTTLAQQISLHLRAPLYELDLIAYDWGFGGKIPLETRLASVEQIAVEPKWVTEGVYLWWTEALMEAADLIVWLDLPFYVNGWRIVHRHIRLNWAGTNRHPSTRKLIRFLVHEMKRQTMRVALVPNAPDDDDALTRPATVSFLKPYTNKTVHCTSPADVAKFSATLSP